MPVAAIMLTGDANLSDAIKPLRQQLAPYMQPCKFIVLDTLPRLANGKTDYQFDARISPAGGSCWNWVIGNRCSVKI
jgi:hypothetical protein